ncbi:MAG: ketopantoate reductase C-terminal domain-containing protein, partial [Hafnia sp.]
AFVMEAEGYSTSSDSLLHYVTNVICMTADNYSSMYQDVLAQRHTEIDYITGYLLKMARKHGISLTENSHVFETIKRKEQTYERIGSGVSGSW